jgi:aspartate kinase
MMEQERELPVRPPLPIVDPEVNFMLKVCKFGGSSLADAARFLRVREIVLSDPDRRAVVVSAPGKRHAADHKITDLLYLCHAHAACGVSCWDLWRRVRERFVSIRDGCALSYPVEKEWDGIYAALGPAMARDELVSRGEYFSAQLLAELLGFEFLDAARWLRFDAEGRVEKKRSYELLRSLAQGKKIVTPGFYGAMPDGEIHTFPRGGSDITGSLAAAALQADVCENWTDVPGLLRADPRLVELPAPIPQLTYRELKILSSVGLQALHDDAVAPVREGRIPLLIKSTLDPDAPGTLVREALDETAKNGVVGFAGRRGLTLLELSTPDPDGEGARVLSCLDQAGLTVFCSVRRPGGLSALLDGPKSGAPALSGRLARLAPSGGVRLRGDMALLACLLRGGGAVPGLLAAIGEAGVPAAFAAFSCPCLLAAVGDSQYEIALRAACAAENA